MLVSTGLGTHGSDQTTSMKGFINSAAPPKSPPELTIAVLSAPAVRCVLCLRISDALCIHSDRKVENKMIYFYKEPCSLYVMFHLPFFFPICCFGFFSPAFEFSEGTSYL